jgi:hypothetical protein
MLDGLTSVCSNLAPSDSAFVEDKMEKYRFDSIIGFVGRIERNDLLLPNIQRDLVWGQDQILKLLDSLLRGYPVGILLIWRTQQQIECRLFTRHYSPGMRFWDQPWSGNDKFKEYVLDGQQRLQALYIALKGTYDKSKVYLDLLPREKSLEPELRFGLHFRAQETRRPTEVPLADVVLPDSNVYSSMKRQIAALQNAGLALEEEAKEQIGSLVGAVISTFNRPDAISYFYADETVDQVFKNTDEVLEIFIRTNSGGTKLDPSDLIFSVVKAEWGGVQSMFEEYLDEINQRGNFAFTTDDLLRMCLVLTGQGAAYSLDKFRGKDAKRNVATIKGSWPAVSDTIKWIADFARDDAQLKSDKLLISYNALLPLMAYVYHRGPSNVGLADKNAMRRWLYRVLLERQFGGAAVTTVNRCVNVITKEFSPGSPFPEQVLYRELGLTEEPSQESILDRGKRSPSESVLPLFVAYMDSGLAFPTINPFHGGNTPEVDHIIPKAKLERIYADAGRTPEYALINNIGNYRVIAKAENRHKGDKWPGTFYSSSEEWEAFRARHPLPEGLDLNQELSTDEYEHFVEARRKLLFDRIRKALSTAG